MSKSATFHDIAVEKSNVAKLTVASGGMRKTLDGYAKRVAATKQMVQSYVRVAAVIFTRFLAKAQNSPLQEGYL
jgi:hypothetical protein